MMANLRLFRLSQALGGRKANVKLFLLRFQSLRVEQLWSRTLCHSLPKPFEEAPAIHVCKFKFARIEFP